VVKERGIVDLIVEDESRENTRSIRTESRAGFFGVNNIERVERITVHEPVVDVIGAIECNPHHESRADHAPCHEGSRSDECDDLSEMDHRVDGEDERNVDECREFESENECTEKSRHEIRPT